MTKYEIAERIRDLSACGVDEIGEEIYRLANKVEADEDTFTYRAIRLDNNKLVEGCVLELDYGEYRIVTSCIQVDDENLFTVCAYEVDPDTITEVCK